MSWMSCCWRISAQDDGLRPSIVSVPFIWTHIIRPHRTRGDSMKSSQARSRVVIMHQRNLRSAITTIRRTLWCIRATANMTASTNNPLNRPTTTNRTSNSTNRDPQVIPSQQCRTQPHKWMSTEKCVCRVAYWTILIHPIYRHKRVCTASPPRILKVGDRTWASENGAQMCVKSVNVKRNAVVERFL